MIGTLFALTLISAALPRDSIIMLPEVRVERERLLTDARRRLPTAFVTELTPREGARTLASIAELVEQAASVHVTQYGGLGAFSTVSLRGAPVGQVAVFLDGVPLNSAAHGIVNLSDLPASAVQRVEIYRGSSPLTLGMAGAGGALNLVTMGSPELRDARLTRGSFGAWEARGTAGMQHGSISSLVHVGYQGSAGDFRYFDDNGTPFNAADDGSSLRANNRFDAGTALASASWKATPRLDLTAREDLFQKRQGVPGIGAVPAYDTRLSLLRSLTQLYVVGRGEGLVPDARLRGAFSHERSQFRDLENELKLGRFDTDDRLDSQSATLELTWPRLPLGLSFETAAELREEGSRTRNSASGFADPPSSRRLAQGVMIGADLRPFGERVTLHAARRWDRLEDHLRSVGVGGGLRISDVARQLEAPQLGVSVEAPLGLELRGNWSDASRAPDFLELFGNQGSVLGNPTLNPERTRSWDAGFKWSRALAAGYDGRCEWAHFESRASDLILYLHNSASSVRAQNISSARIRGEELSYSLRAPFGLSASGALTWSSALNDGAVPFWYGKSLPQHPDREAYSRLDLERGRIELATDVQYISDDYLDPSNRQRVPSRTLVGASLAIAPLGPAFRVIVEGKNLGDRRVSDVAGFPLPGRGVFASCEVRLGPQNPTSR